MVVHLQGTAVYVSEHMLAMHVTGQHSMSPTHVTAKCNMTMMHSETHGKKGPVGQHSRRQHTTAGPLPVGSH
jgi:hypothetical protein